MEKQTVLLAEQVGIFLMPTIKTAVESLILKSQNESLARMLDLSKTIDLLKSSAASDLQVVQSALGKANESVRLLGEKFASDLTHFQEVSAAKGDIEELKSASQNAAAELREMIGKLQFSTDRLAESMAVRASQIDGIKEDIGSVREEALALVDTVHRGALAATTGLQSDLARLQKTVAELPPPQVVTNMVEAPSLGDVVTALEPFIADRVKEATDLIKPAAPLPAIEPDPAVIADAVAAAVKAVKLPSIDYSKVETSLTLLVKEAVAALPPVKPADPLPAIEPDPAAIADAVAAAVKAIEIPTGPTLDQVLERVTPELNRFTFEVIQTGLAKIKPLPAIEPDPTAIADAVALAVKAIELPTIDKDAVSDELIRLVDEKFDQAVPSVQRALARNLHDEIAKAVAALPAPASGKDGTNGKDGLMPLVEPYVEGYVYERGMAAMHGGGTWQATRRTKAAPAPGMPDWQALAVGVAGLALAVGPDGRTVELKAAMSDGGVAESSVKLPTMVYKGVYDEIADYDVGDSVTFKGAIWTAKSPMQGVKPAEHAERWQLSVKPGRDGKDGNDGKDGVQFQAGYAGEYEQNKVYIKNSIVSYASSLWLAKRPTKEIPPYMAMQDNEHWLRVR